jgi:PAS domain S-box-containing protein
MICIWEENFKLNNQENIPNKKAAALVKYKEIFENSPISLIIIDNQGEIIDCNCATERLYGYTKKEMIGNKYNNFIAIPLNQILLTIEVGNDLFNGQGSDFIEVKLKNKEGVSMWIGLQFFAIEISDLKLIQIVSQDISERKIAKDRILKLEKELSIKEKLAVIGEIAGSVAHELRNPLAAIKNNIYYLTKIIQDESQEILDVYSNIESDIRRVNKIISDLLNYARIDHLDLNFIDIRLLIDNAVKKIQIPEGIAIVKDYQENIPDVKVDFIRFEQIMINLIRNAIDAMEDVGTLTISIEYHNNQILLTITDTGSGIKSENLKKIFEPFFSTKVWGFGLGLPIAKKFIELHNGSISVESELGKYTSFKLILPIGK